jgi:hypothetical protein
MAPPPEDQYAASAQQDDCDYQHDPRQLVAPPAVGARVNSRDSAL